MDRRAADDAPVDAECESSGANLRSPAESVGGAGGAI